MLSPLAYPLSVLLVLVSRTDTSTGGMVDTLLGSYQKEVHPRPEDNQSVYVTLDLAIRQVVDLAETKQILTTNLWIRMNWTDHRLTWNPSSFDGIDTIYVPLDSIWTPDVTLYDDTAFGSNVALSERKFHKLKVTNEGRVTQRFPTVLSSICGVDTTYFPFDKQLCPLKFGLWLHDDDIVTLTSDQTGDTTSYLENAEWFLTGIDAEKKPYLYNGLVYSTITYTVSIQRRPAFFMLTLFFPCFLLSSMSILGFLLPPTSGEKVGLQVTLLLSLTVFLFLTIDTLPPNSEPLPLMCVYFVLVIMIATTSCVLAVIVQKIHLKSKQGWKVPPLARTVIIHWLGRLVLMKRPHVRRKHTNEDLEAERGGNTVGIQKTPTAATADAPAPSTLPREYGAFREILTGLEQLLKRHEGEKATDDTDEYEDWLTIASILDRFFLILSVVISFVISTVFLIHFSV
ncbi:acetylcholine receptor subunit alpha-like isoform X1 [Haliotis rufescens]|uniref:acetylcholine receptor subunit alpha-like isoform X1 n=2 Tax=Haliotis rufescens TaxID=6454 RepID=UPI001EB08138|nr:acetylcholine receptor subunit alpha-like isoform X1 [Haliotis rufescens]